jgi:regulator of RNase E activity RraA
MLRQVSTATIATQLFRRGLHRQFLVGVAKLGAVAERVVGEAFTMRFIPSREDIDTLESLYGDENLQWQAVEQIGDGQVMVVDSMRSIDAATAGDMLVARAMVRGAAAFVTDGAFRDGAEVSALAIPTYARAVTSTSRLSSFHVADLQVPIGCAGVAVYPGDVVVCDADGVIVVPRYLAAAIASPALEQERLEGYLHGRVRGGESLWGLYPPNEKTLSDYGDWSRANARVAP